MALEVKQLDSRLQIQFDLGVDGKGNKVTRTKTFSRVKNDITDQDLYDVANALIGLQEYPANLIRKVAHSEYSED